MHAIPGSSLVMIDKAAHFNPIEQPCEIAAALQAWMAKITGSFSEPGHPTLNEADCLSSNIPRAGPLQMNAYLCGVRLIALVLYGLLDGRAECLLV